MPFKYSARSQLYLSTCDSRLQKIFTYALDRGVVDITILSGYRDRDEQDELVRAGRSNLSWPKSKHNKRPSLAVDAAPYPIDWEDRVRATLFAGWIQGLALGQFGIRLLWGGDWDMDFEVKDNRFNDLWHFELPYTEIGLP